ncbi:MAG: protein kinase [Planctomycetes bacterium]|nr:protein kinase [Planctomycetota bacterium]
MAKAALEYRACAPEVVRQALTRATPGALSAELQRSGLSPAALKHLDQAARRCVYYKGEDTYLRLAVSQGKLSGPQAEGYRKQAQQARERIGATLVAGGVLSRDEDTSFTAQVGALLEQEGQRLSDALQARGFAGIEQPSKLLAAVVHALGPLPAEQAPPPVVPAPQPLPELPAMPTMPGRDAPAASLPADLVGTGIEQKFRVERKLGEGGMGAVYLAYALDDVDGAQPMALKVARAGSGGGRSEEAAARFKREILATSFCAHENIIEIYDAGETQDGSYYMAMECIEGEQLDETVAREGPLPIPRLVRLLEQALEGLAAVHEANIVHRDIKPQNFRLGRDAQGNEQLKIMDFGIARVLDAEESGRGEHFFTTMATKITGSPAYLSPESITDPSAVDQRSDLYSLGISIYRVAVGRLPFLARKADQFLQLHLYSTPPSLRAAVPSTPPALEELYLKLLAKLPENRIQTAREALNWLRERVIPELEGATGRLELSGAPAGDAQRTTRRQPHGAPAPGEEATQAQLLGTSQEQTKPLQAPAGDPFEVTAPMDSPQPAPSSAASTEEQASPASDASVSERSKSPQVIQAPVLPREEASGAFWIVVGALMLLLAVGGGVLIWVYFG